MVMNIHSRYILLLSICIGVLFPLFSASHGGSVSAESGEGSLESQGQWGRGIQSKSWPSSSSESGSQEEVNRADRPGRKHGNGPNVPAPNYHIDRKKRQAINDDEVSRKKRQGAGVAKPPADKGAASSGPAAASTDPKTGAAPPPADKGAGAPGSATASGDHKAADAKLAPGEEAKDGNKPEGQPKPNPVRALLDKVTGNDKKPPPADKDAAPAGDKDGATADKDAALKDKDAAPEDKDAAPEDKDAAPEDKDAAPAGDKDADPDAPKDDKADAAPADSPDSDAPPPEGNDKKDGAGEGETNDGASDDGAATDEGNAEPDTNANPDADPTSDSPSPSEGEEDTESGDSPATNADGAANNADTNNNENNEEANLVKEELQDETNEITKEVKKVQNKKCHDEILGCYSFHHSCHNDPKVAKNCRGTCNPECNEIMAAQRKKKTDCDDKYDNCYELRPRCGGKFGNYKVENICPSTCEVCDKLHKPNKKKKSGKKKNSHKEKRH